MYNNKAPRVIDKTDTMVPIHLPNKIPEIIKSGEPNPSSEIQIKVNRKNTNKFIKESDNFSFIDLIFSKEIYLPILVFLVFILMSLVIKKKFFNVRNK